MVGVVLGAGVLEQVPTEPWPPKLASPHDLRRTFGRILCYEKGVDINEIRSLYGHAATEQTLDRIGAVSDKMRAAVERFDSPRPKPVLAGSGSPLTPCPEGRYLTCAQLAHHSSWFSWF